MTDHIKDLLTATFTIPTDCERIHLFLHLIEKEYNKHFDYITIIRAMLWWDKTNHDKVGWIKQGYNVWLKLYQWLEKFSLLLALSETLFIIDNIIADKRLTKRSEYQLGLLSWGTLYNPYLFLLTNISRLYQRI